MKVSLASYCLKCSCSIIGDRSITSGRSSRAFVGMYIPEAFLGGIVRSLVDQLRPRQWLASHKRHHAACGRVQPIDLWLVDIFGDALNTIVQRPAVVGIEIAFPF